MKLIVFLTLSSVSLAAVAPQAQTAQKPTFNCAKPAGEVEAMICKDDALIALDRQLADVMARALKRLPPKTAAEQRTVQRAWMTERNSCVEEDDPRACIDVSYRMRIVELQIKSAQLRVPKPVGFVCTGGDGQPLSVTFYNDTDPKSAVITYGNDQVIAFAARTASGSRYTAKDVDFWEHEGDATLTWSGSRVTCKSAGSGR